MFGFFSNTFDNLKNAVSKTAKTLVGNVVDTVQDEKEFSDFVLEDMEDLLISADLGVNYASELVDNLRNQTKIRPSEVKNYLKTSFLDTLTKAGDTKLNITDGLNILFITGVNGVGKTTLIGKLAYQFKQGGKKVLVAAADTFRAAAEEQLDIWSKRAGADIVRKDKGDPAAVVYEAIEKAKNENYDILLVDTAGRLQNKFNLMEELSKEEYRYSRIPVYDETIDEIKGILYIKDVLKNIGKKNFKVKNVVKDAYFVSQTRLINEVFKELQKNKMQIAIIIDEYGGRFNNNGGYIRRACR